MNILSLIVRGTRETGFKTLWDSLTYLVRKRWYRARFGKRKRRHVPGTGYTRPGRVMSYTRQGQTVTIPCADATYILTILAPDLVRVRLLPPHVPADRRLHPSYSIAKTDAEWSPCDFLLTETETALKVETARLVCRIAKDTGRLAFLDLLGQVISEDEAGAGWQACGAVACRKRIQPDEHFYGLGERTFGLDLRGRQYGMWNTDPRTYKLGQDPIHLCIPVLLGLHGRGCQGYGVFFDNTFRGFFDLGQRDPDVLSFGAAGGEMRYYFIYGPALTTVLERYTELTGRMNLPPLWMLGYHQSRWSYQPEARVRKLARDFRQVYRVPCDGIHLDIHYMDGYRCFTWDAERFPDPAKKIADLHAMGFKIIVIVDPGIRADHDYPVCREGLERNVFCTYPDGETPFKAPVWPGDCYFPDFTDPRARMWWGDLCKTLTDVGVDGIWNDMNEPAIFGLRSTTMPQSIRHDMDGHAGGHAEAHNIYGMQMARATVEGLRQLRPDRRPVCITRSGWAGVQRYAMSWTGDNRSNWRHLWLSMPMVMNLGLSGLAHTGPDVGGFSQFASGELFTRWLQMGVFLPFCRAHTFVHSPDQEPWSWGEPYLAINRRYIELRYRLLPYLYTAFWQCAQTGLPIVRPLLLAFQDDAQTYTLEDQFMCGDAFLVAPVFEESADRRSVYLPAGSWYDFWTDQHFHGPAWIDVDAPLERLPLFVRGGSVVPMGPVMQYVGEHPTGRLELHAYPRRVSHLPDGRDNVGRSVLYEDDGRSWTFQDGEYRLTRFALHSAGHPISRLELGRQVEGRYESGCRGFEVVVHGVDESPRSVTGRTINVRGRMTNVHGRTINVRGRTVHLVTSPFDHLQIDWD